MSGFFFILEDSVIVGVLLVLFSKFKLIVSVIKLCLCWLMVCVIFSLVWVMKVWVCRVFGSEFILCSLCL